MALPSSGEISLLSLQNEYGGGGEISLSEYYRNGAYVPNSIGSTVREPSSGDYYNLTSNPYYGWATYYGSSTVLFTYWNGSDAGVPAEYVGTSYTVGSYTYYRGSFKQSVVSKFFSSDEYGIYRTSGSSTLVNQNVPTSGQISLSNFYGGRKT